MRTETILESETSNFLGRKTNMDISRVKSINRQLNCNLDDIILSQFSLVFLAPLSTNINVIMIVSLMYALVIQH